MILLRNISPKKAAIAQEQMKAYICSYICSIWTYIPANHIGSGTWAQVQY